MSEKLIFGLLPYANNKSPEASFQKLPGFCAGAYQPMTFW